MILNILEQLENLRSRSLEENIQLCGQLEQALKQRRLWRRLAHAVHLLLFAAACFLFAVMIRAEVLMETGRSAEIPPLFNPVSPRMFTEADLPVLYIKYFILILVLLALPIVTDVIFSAKAKAPLTPESSPRDEPPGYLEKTLKKADSALSTFGGGLLHHGMCALLAMTGLNICDSAKYGDPNSMVLMFFALSEAALLISLLPMRLLFPTGKELKQLQKLITPDLSRYIEEETLTQREEARKKEEEAKIAAMTPEERQQYELQKQQKKREAEERRAKEREEEEDMKRWMATHRAACRYFSAGICGYHSDSDYTSHCKYPSDPGQCATCLMEKGLIFVSIV